MLNSSFIKIISSATLQELKQFLLFSEAGYFNTNSKISTLLNYLIGLKLKYDEKNCDRNEIFKHIFIQEKFDYQKLRHLFSYSLKLYEQFLIFEKLRKNQSKMLLEQLEFYAETNFESRFNKIELKLQETLKQDKNLNYQLLSDFYKTKNTNNIFKGDYQKQNDLQKASDLLDKNYLLQKLREACDMKNRSLFINQEYDLGLLHCAIDHLKKNIQQFEDDYPIIIYYQIFITLTEPENLDNFNALKKNASLFFDQFKWNEARDIYFYMLNFTTRKINNGYSEFNHEVLEIYKILLKHQFIFDNNELSERHYKNIITIGLRTTQQAFVENFIKTYKKFLPKELRENAYNFNLANFYYETNNYEEAQKYLFNVNYSDIIYNLGAKCLLLRIYFDTDEEEALKSHINAFKIYLTRNKLIANNKYKRYYQFLKISNSIFKIKYDIGYDRKNKTQERLQKIKVKLEAEKSITNIEWLNKKVEEIEKRILDKN